MKPIELLKKHCEFNTSYDVYVLLCVSRKKDVKNITNSQEIVFREIIRSEKDIIRKYNKIKNQAKNYKDENGKTYPFYIYVSLNARDSLKTFFYFQKRLIDWSEQLIKGSNTVHKQICRTDRQFLSILAKPECRSKNRYFMIDLDEKNKLDKLITSLTTYNIPIETYHETKNGYHIKLKPFDRKIKEEIDKDWLEDNITIDWEIKTDAQLFVEYIEK